jgi:hypothetical protein
MNAALRCHTHLVRSRLRTAHLQREATTFLLRNAPLAALARAPRKCGVAGFDAGLISIEDLKHPHDNVHSQR